MLARVDAVLAQSRKVRSPRLADAPEAARNGRAVAVVALADPVRRERAEQVLALLFDIAAAGDGRGADLIVVDADAVIPQAGGLLVGPTVLRIALADGPARENAIALNDELARIADLAVRERQLSRDVDTAANALVALATAFESHDRSTMGHSERVASRATAIARRLGLDSASCRTVRLGALLRDIGNCKLPLGLVRKATALGPEERRAIEAHPILGEELLTGFRPLARLLPIIRSHHEHLDGSGYPDGLRAPQIPLEVRIVAVADRFEALLIDRPDRPAVTAGAAVVVLQQAIQRSELDAAVVAALAADVRDDQREGDGVA